jgi:hypothetical protein
MTENPYRLARDIRGGRVVAATEIPCGLPFTAILTGLTFVRFSRPRARLVFAANPVVAMHNGKPTLMVRIGNRRATNAELTRQLGDRPVPLTALCFFRVRFISCSCAVALSRGRAPP